MSNFASILCVLLQFLLIKSQETVYPRTLDDNTKCQNPKKYNAVLFLADPVEACNERPKREVDYNFATQFLKFDEKCRVKHCTSSLESRVGDTFDSVLRYNRGVCKCEDLLKKSILDLINYCRDHLQMTTAMASVSNNSFTSDIRFRSAESHSETIQAESPEETCPDKKEEELPFLQSAKNVSTRDMDYEGQAKLQKVSNDEDKFPIFELLNPNNSLKVKSVTVHKANKRSKLDVITSPEHTEVFKIRSKRDNDDKKGPVRDVPAYNREGRPKSIWSLLNIMENIGQSFFSNIFGDDSEKLEENSFNMGAIGTVNEISLFEVVKKTFTAISSQQDSGYLMVVIGGKLADIAEPYSPLMQSMKYVIENTDENDTLVVLTGYCPSTSASAPGNGEGQTRLAGNKRRKMIPVYARGCKDDVFKSSNELYDVPMAIKKYLMDKNGETPQARAYSSENVAGRAGSDPSILIRKKRSLLDNIKTYTNNIGNENDTKQVLLSYAFIAALFIFCF